MREMIITQFLKMNKITYRSWYMTWIVKKNLECHYRGTNKSVALMSYRCGRESTLRLL